MSVGYGRSAAAAMAFAGAAMRTFLGMGVEYSAAYNASWVCPVAGLFLCLPLALSCKYAGKTGNDSVLNNLTKYSPGWLTSIISCMFALMLLYDCAIALRITASTANFVSLNDISLPLLTLPLLLTAFSVGCLPPDAEGNSARIWLLILPLMLIIVAAVQFESYNPAWLAPVWGGGIASIAQGGLYCGGWLALLLLPWLTAIPDRKKNRPLRPVILASFAAAFLLIALQMLCPAMIETNLSEIARAEIILSNNRVSHILQMFLTLLWFGSLLHLLCIELCAAISFALNRFPRMKRWIASAACAGLAGVLSLSDLMSNAVSSRIYLYQFIVIGAAFSLLMSFFIFKNGEKVHA